MDTWVIQSHLTLRGKLTLDNIREAHKAVEGGKGAGKTVLGGDEPGEQEAFC